MHRLLGIECTDAGRREIQPAAAGLQQHPLQGDVGQAVLGVGAANVAVVASKPAFIKRAVAQLLRQLAVAALGKHRLSALCRYSLRLHGIKNKNFGVAFFHEVPITRCKTQSSLAGTLPRSLALQSRLKNSHLPFRGDSVPSTQRAGATAV